MNIYVGISSQCTMIRFCCYSVDKRKYSYTRRAEPHRHTQIVTIK